MTNYSITRRAAFAVAVVGTFGLTSFGCNQSDSPAAVPTTSDGGDPPETSSASTPPSNTDSETDMRIHYLEIVTQEVDATCTLYSKVHGVTFSEPDPSLGGARTAELAGGGMIGVRAPMHDGERAVTRAYMLVSDIEAAVAAAKESGAEIAVPPMEIPGHGTIAIFIQGGIESGLWQL